MTELTIREANIKCHLDIEEYVASVKDSEINFTLRVNGGNIVDFVHTEYVPVQKRYFNNKVGEFKLTICQTSIKPSGS